MTDVATGTEESNLSTTEPLTVVSIDSHVGPTLEQMRPYCPKEWLDEYDAFATNIGPEFDIWRDIREELDKLEDREEAALRADLMDRNRNTMGHTDMDARRRDMDAEGVAADVIFHSSQNGEPIPFVVGGSLWFNPTSGDLERAGLGFHIYSAWLADACQTAPGRHLGVLHVPAWDIDASIREVKWAKEVGLACVNMPTPRDGITIYDHPDWEPFWATCEELEMPINTHVGGAGGPIEFIGPQKNTMMYLERSGWLSRRGLPRMLFSGVFERHPGLKYILTEQTGEWWDATMREYDSVYKTNYWMLKDQMPKKPSEYCHENVWVGGSYMAPFEAQLAVEHAYNDNIMWGSDYPHAEGTYQYLEGTGQENSTRLALRHTFSAVEPHHAKAMLGDNAIRCFGLDADRLARIASEINAPTLEELSHPPDALPEWTFSMAFRTEGPWG
jgi:predicted TIM-barrel fold metal-dependent hydrolase